MGGVMELSGLDSISLMIIHYYVLYKIAYIYALSHIKKNCRHPRIRTVTKHM